MGKLKRRETNTETMVRLRQTSDDEKAKGEEESGGLNKPIEGAEKGDDMEKKEKRKPRRERE